MTQLALPLWSPATLLQRLRAAGLPPTVPVVEHHNRRIMLSFGQIGGLRVHAGYAGAPDEVIEAIVAWALPARRGGRKVAALVLRQYRVPGADRDVPRRRPEPAVPGDDVRIAKLEALHHSLNQRWFGGKLTSIAIGLSGKMRRKLGHYESRSNGAARIVIGRRHLRRDGWAAVTDTLLHEMVHQWQEENGHPLDHGPIFRAKARAVGIEARAVMTDWRRAASS